MCTRGGLTADGSPMLSFQKQISFLNKLLKICRTKLWQLPSSSSGSVNAVATSCCSGFQAQTFSREEHCDQ